jgi:hypothetical protein
MNTHEVALTKGEGRSIWLLGDLYTFKVTGEALSVTELLSATQLTIPPRVKPGVVQKLIALAPKYHLQIPPPPQ